MNDPRSNTCSEIKERREIGELQTNLIDNDTDNHFNLNRRQSVIRVV